MASAVPTLPDSPRAARPRASRNGPDDPCQRPGKPATLELAGGTLGRLAHPIAEVLSPPHHGAALTDPAQAAGVGGHDHTGARRLRGPKLRQAQAGDEGVHVNDVGPLIRQPSVQQLGAPSNDQSLAFGACRRGRDRIAIHRDSIMFVHTLAVVCRVRGGHEHLVTRGAQAAA